MQSTTKQCTESQSHQRHTSVTPASHQRHTRVIPKVPKHWDDDDDDDDVLPVITIKKELQSIILISSISFMLHI